MKKTIPILFSICVLFLALLVGVLIGRRSQSGYINLLTNTEASSTATVDGSNVGKVNINTATVEELQQLNGIGKVIAERIVLYRIENGPFRSIFELLNVEGIGEKKFCDVMDWIYVGG